MTDLDGTITQYRNLANLNLCGKYLNDFDGKLFPPSLRTLELQANRISQVESFAEYLPSELLYLGLAKNLLNSGKPFC
jgi:Leucine-rich repeat (LRR) protein